MQLREATLARPLLERETEVKRIEGAIAAAVGGVGSMIALEGEAGIGKTSLLDHAISCCCAAGVRVLSARGGEIEREFAYGIVRQFFEATLASAAREDRRRWLSGAAGLAAPILTGDPARGGRADPSPILHGLYWLTTNLAVEQPLLLAVDDAHWADDASIAFLSYLARRVDELPVAIIYGARTGEGASDQLPAVAEPKLASTVLRPSVLSPNATARLIEQALGRPGSARFTAACHAATGGNPFLLQELLRVLYADGIEPEDASASRVEQIAPDAIARTTLARLRRLGEAANELAFAVAVLGVRAELRHAAALAKLNLDVAARAADALAATAILRDGRPLEFIHPIVRTSVYNELPAGRRAVAHKRAARLLAHGGADDVALAPHLLAAEPGADPWVVKRLRRAAQDVLERGAPDAACTYLERAYREPAPASERVAVLLALGKAEILVARPAARDHLRAALVGAADAQTRFEATHELTWALFLHDQIEEAVELAADVLAGVPPEDRELMLRFEGWFAAFAQFAPRCARAALDRIGRYDGTLRGETPGERLILACLAHRATQRGHSATIAAQHAELALAGGKLLEDLRLGSANYFLAVWALVYADRLDSAERYFDLALDQARERGLASAFDIASACRCQVLIRQGRLAQAEAEALTVLAADRAHAVARPMLLSCLLHTIVERADPSTWKPFLTEHAVDGDDLWDKAVAGMLLFHRGHLRLAAGEPRAALADFDQLRRRDELSGLDTPGMPSRASQALAHLQLGGRDAARWLPRSSNARGDGRRPAPSASRFVP